MRNLRQSTLVKRLTALSRKNYIQWGGAVLIFSACILAYMGPSVTTCTQSFYGYPGDGSGGIGWFQWADGNDPIWDTTSQGNYPYGENLKRPQFVTSYLQFIPYWFFSVLTSQLCGINIMVFLGFLSSALAMFGLVRWLLRSYPVAIFAGYASAFVPYHVLKAGSHIAYNYSIFFVLMLWIFLAFYRKPSYKLAVAGSLVYAGSFYFDGYFIFISSVMVFALAAALVMRNFVDFNKSDDGYTIRLQPRRTYLYLKQHIGYYLVAVISLLLLLMPLAYVYLTKGKDIQSSLGSSRSSIQEEAAIYGATPEDYVLPNPVHPLLEGNYTEWRKDNIHNSNLTENTLFIGYTVIVLAVIGVVGLFKNRRGKDMSFRKLRFPAFAAVCLIIIGGLFAAPPSINLFGVVVQTPSALVIQITENWRVLARLFLFIHIGWVILASVGLYWLVRGRRLRNMALISALAFAAILFEFSPSIKLPVWNLEKGVPTVYKQIARDDSIRAIAEYPVTDHPSHTLPLSFTFQQIHEKPLVNANDSNTPQRYLRQGIAGIADAQTLPVLRGLGVNMITTYDIDASGVAGLRQYQKPDKTTDWLLSTIYSYKIGDGARATYALTAMDGFVSVLDASKTRSTLTLTNVGLLRVENLGTDETSKKVTVSFEVAPANGGASSLEIYQGNNRLWGGVITEPRTVSFTANSEDLIKVVTPGHDIDPVLHFRNLTAE